MPKLNHIASITQDPHTVAKFYATIFHMSYDHRSSRHGYSATAREGYVGLNFNPIMPGWPGPMSLDHFGVEVWDVDAVLDKIGSDYPNICVVGRPDSSPFPGYLSHDPVGSIFAISEVGDTPTASERTVTANFSRFNDADPRGRFLHHYAIRCKRVVECADFYEDIFGFMHWKDGVDDPVAYQRLCGHQRKRTGAGSYRFHSRRRGGDDCLDPRQSQSLCAGHGADVAFRDGQPAFRRSPGDGRYTRPGLLNEQLSFYRQGRGFRRYRGSRI